MTGGEGGHEGMWRRGGVRDCETQLAREVREEHPQPLDCSLHPDRRVLHLRQYILHPVYILYIPGGLRVWGWDSRHAAGAPVRVLSAVPRPGGAPAGARAAKPP